MADQKSSPHSRASTGFNPSHDPSYSTSSKQAKQPDNNKSQAYPASESADNFAQPSSSHNYTHNIPLTPLPPLPTLPTPTPFPAPKRSVTTPLSTGNKALRFASITGTKAAGSEDKARPTDPRRKSGSDVTTVASEGTKRRASAGQKNNVHTRSGRHGDEWLFGGWSRFWGENSTKEDAEES